jgi:2-polyprenyl-3-methyl-5-hydroxy-6-metoxy-1,4-benzoquinol methylase
VAENKIEQEIKDYWNKQPCNVKHGTSEVGSRKFFNEVTAKRYKAEPHNLDFPQFHQYRGKRVLEIGCGIGTDAQQFAQNGANYVGIDLSDESLALSKQRFEVFDLHGEFHNVDMTDTDALAKLGTFDLVYSYGVIHHFPNIEKIIDNAHGLLNTNGEFKFMVYAKNSWKYAMIRKGLDQFEAQSDCPYADAYTSEEITELLGEKFHVERLRQAHCFMYNIDKYKQGQFELEPWFEAMPELMREAVREYLGWHLLIKARKLNAKT